MGTPAHDHSHSADGHGESFTGFTLRTYLTGFFASVALTVVPFWIVMNGLLSATVAAVVIVALAVAQILVHTFTFLHVNARAQGGWILVAYVFTAVILLIAVGGSLWIMWHLNSNMMPGMMMDPTSAGPAP